MHTYACVCIFMYTLRIHAYICMYMDLFLFLFCGSMGKKPLKEFKSCWLLESWAIYKTFWSQITQHLFSACYHMSFAVSFEETAILSAFKSLPTIFPLHNTLVSAFLNWFCLTDLQEIQFSNPCGFMHILTKPSSNFLFISAWKGFTRTVLHWFLVF